MVAPTLWRVRGFQSHRCILDGTEKAADIPGADGHCGSLCLHRRRHNRTLPSCVAGLESNAIEVANLLTLVVSRALAR